MTLFLWFLGICTAVIVAIVVHALITRWVDVTNDDVFRIFNAKIEAGEIDRSFDVHREPIDFKSLVYGATMWFCGLGASYILAFAMKGDVEVGLVLIGYTIAVVFFLVYMLHFSRLGAYAPDVQGVWIVASFYWMFAACAIFIILSLAAGAKQGDSKRP